MRKLTAILLISIFAFSQYARQLSYLECQLSNAFKTGTVKCDCEKKAGFSKQGNDPSPVSHTHTHIHLDDLYPLVRITMIGTYFRDIPSLPYVFNSEDESGGNPSKPWQPPNS